MNVDLLTIRILTTEGLRVCIPHEKGAIKIVADHAGENCPVIDRLVIDQRHFHAVRLHRQWQDDEKEWNQVPGEEQETRSLRPNTQNEKNGQAET